jgi:hypothetical protein
VIDAVRNVCEYLIANGDNANGQHIENMFLQNLNLSESEGGDVIDQLVHQNARRALELLGEEMP